MRNIHATAVRIDGRGVLIRGPSGSGKSDLAVRLIEAGGDLVADDQVFVAEEHGKLIARAPDQICGKIELRGYGIITMPYRSDAEIDLVVDLKPSRDIERMPDGKTVTLEGVAIPVLDIDGFEASAVAKIRLILNRPRA